MPKTPQNIPRTALWLAAAAIGLTVVALPHPAHGKLPPPTPAEQAAAAQQAETERAQKAQEQAEPAKFDAAVSSQAAMMVDEDEAMIDAIETYMDAHAELKAGHDFDSYAIERQVAGPGGTVVATVAASARSSASTSSVERSSV